MRTLMTTVAGWRGTTRSIRWSPVLVTPVAASVALVGTWTVGGSAPAGLTLVGDAGLAFTAVAAGFIVDDVTGEAAPATPVDGRARLVARAAVVVPVAVAGWLLVLAVYQAVTSSPGDPDIAGRARSGLAMASAAFGFAALGGKLRSVVSPGAAGFGAMACVGVASQVAPAGWRQALPPGEVVSVAAILFGLVTLALATREPAR